MLLMPYLIMVGLCGVVWRGGVLVVVWRDGDMVWYGDVIRDCKAMRPCYVVLWIDAMQKWWRGVVR